ncbi:hypothetical protein [Ferrovibrio sp.]|uniref:hypothetical protein n=1 Tax=Ferrovibrio sp. TaxID=1917215 RepID=UPI0035167A8B
MTPQQIEALWREARQIDPSLKLRPGQAAALVRRQLKPEPYSRPRLFAAMAAGQPVLFADFPVPVRGAGRLGPGPAVLCALETGFPPDHRVHIRCGPAGTPRLVTVTELLRRWRGGRARVSVTDLHVRGSGVMRRIDCSTLSDFNLLAECRGEIGLQEMLTMVVSSAGTFTDSHTDDPDGSNHCFTGRKLWLAWDTFAGLRHGLEDVERSGTRRDRAAFGMDGFLAVPGARWFTVEAGQTLFLPGHLTHKVVTLEDYLGIGSFFVMLPDWPRTQARWRRHGPLWAQGEPPERRFDLVDRIGGRVREKVHALARSPKAERERWGLAQMRQVLSHSGRATEFRPA